MELRVQRVVTCRAEVGTDESGWRAKSWEDPLRGDESSLNVKGRAGLPDILYNIFMQLSLGLRLACANLRAESADYLQLSLKKP